MKYPIYSKRARWATLSAFLLGGLSSANAAITIHGSTTAYAEAGGDWLTMGTNDIDASGGLASDGYIFAGIVFDDMGTDVYNGGPQNNNDGMFSTVTSLPSYVTSVTAGTNQIGTTYANGDYGVLDDPLLGDGTDAGYGFWINTGGSIGSELEALSFVVSGLPAGQVTRVGIFSGGQHTTDGRWDASSITLSDGTATATVGVHGVGGQELVANPGGSHTGVGWVFFDIDADGTYTVSGTRHSTNGGMGIGGLTFDSIILTTPIWQVDGNGDWSTPANWSSSVPNAASAEAIFSDALPLTGPLTATLDIAVTLGDLTLSSAQAITVGGAEILTFDGGGAAGVSATAGSHLISAPVSLTDPLDVDLDSGSALDISGAVSGSGSLTNSGAGQLSVSGAVSGGGALTNSGAGDLTVSGLLSGSGSVTNSGAGQLTLSGDLSGHTGSIISDAGTVVVSGTDASVIIANAGTVEVSGSGVGNIIVASGATLTGEGSHTGTLDLAAGSILNVDPTNGTTAFDTGTLISTASVNVDFGSSPLGLGTFTVLNYTTNGGALETDFVSPEYRITFADTTTSITGTVAPAETSIWTPGVTNPTFWDNGISDNWNSSDTFFFTGDIVTFSDLGVGTVAVQTAVAPATVTFTNTSGNDYTVNDLTANVESISAETGGINVTGDGNVTINTKITGSTDILHSGAGTLTIGAGVGNDFVGVVAVNGSGTLNVGSNNFLGDVSNTITLGTGATLDLNDVNNLQAYDASTFIFADGATLTNNGGNLNQAFSDQIQLGGNLTIDGAGRIDILDTITVTGSSIVITMNNDTGAVIGGDNSAQSIGQWIVNDGLLLASRGTSSLGSGASVTVNTDGTLAGNTGTAFDNGSGFGVADIGNAITLSGGKLSANQNFTTTIYSGTITVTDDSSIDANGARTVVLSGNLTESGAAGDLTIGNGTTRIASTFDSSLFTGDFIFNEGGNIDLEDGADLTTDIVIDDVGGNKQLRLLAGNSAEISGGITINESTANEFDLNVVDGADTLTVSGVISGSGAAGVTKTSPGNLILSGVNTYTGNTKIWNGVVTLVDDAQLTFVPTTNGTSNTVNGASGAAGTLNLDGDIYLDLSGADTTPGNSWLLINDSMLADVVYGGTFSVNSSLGIFTENGVDSGVWELVDGDETWTFTEATGSLSLPLGSPYAVWASTNGLTEGVNDGATDDPDGDGENLYEYFFWDSDPLVAEVFGSELTGVDGSGALSGTLVFSHDRPQDISDVTVTYQWTTDLTAGWNDDGASDGTNTVTFATGTLSAPANGNGTDYESVEVTATVTVGTPTQIFVRVSVTQP